MTFYLKPPDGTVATHIFQQYVESRLHLLIAITRNNYRDLAEAIEANSFLVHGMDCLVEGSPKDRVSHFALASVLLDSNIKDVVTKGEIRLFELRMERMKDRELEKSLRKLLRHLEPYIPFLLKLGFKGHSSFLESSSQILQKIIEDKLLCCKWKRSSPTTVGTVKVKALGEHCPLHGREIILSVPFTHLPNLVGRKKVSLRKGYAGLHCSQLRTYILVIFSKLLECSRDVMRSRKFVSKVEADPRIARISKKVLETFSSQGFVPSFLERRNLKLLIQGRTARPTLETLENEMSQYFPPCMQNLYKNLLTNHRLCHHPRVQFTLFLKEIGLSVEECIRLIQHEYSKPSVSNTTLKSRHKCEHSWQADGRRYTYGTRHLYGLEGHRKQYSSHSCSSIQGNTRIGCGGCPFTSMNEVQRNEYFKEYNLMDVAGKDESQCNITPIEMCHLSLKCKLRRATGESLSYSENITFTKPIQYFMFLKNVPEIMN